MDIGLNVAIGPDGPQRHDDIVAEVRAAADAGRANAWWPQLPPADRTRTLALLADLAR